MFVRPTLPELVTRIEQDFVSRLGASGALLRRAVVRVLARVVAGATHMLHGHLEFLAAQIFGDTAEGSYLVRLAGLFGVFRNAAQFSGGRVVVTGVDGTVIPINTVFTRADGVTYKTLAEVIVAAGVASPSVVAVLAGADGDAGAGVVLSFESPVVGADATVTVDVDGLTGGANEEDDEDLRTRFLQRLRNPPQGGADPDYVGWARAVPGVTRAWCYPRELGAGTVVVRFVRDDDPGLIPSVGEVAAVQAYIDARRPATATVTVLAPIDTPLNLTIAITPSNTTTKAAVTAELADLLARGVPSATTLKSQINLAVGNAAGVTDYTVSVPAGDVTHTTGQLATLGTITWL